MEQTKQSVARTAPTYYPEPPRVASSSDTSSGALVSEENGEPEKAPQGGLQRKLQARHVQMIAIGSNIGTGLFVGSGSILHTGGPLALVLGFVLVAFSLSIMMQCLGEMSVVLPVSGSFTRYATRFYDESLGFAMGWQYWLAWVSVFGAESSAFVILINFWNDDKSLTALWISIFVLINLVIHLCPVRVFGEVEFVVSAIKVVSVVVFIIVTWAIMGGAGSHGHRHGNEYWKLPGLENGLHNGFKGMAAGFVTASFAAGGVEVVGIVAGETAQPRWSIPRAIKTLMYRIVIFYIVSMIFLSFVVPYNDDSLVGGSNANSSPFVLAIKNAGVRGLPDLLNAVVMICVCSVGITSIYISSRTLQAMAEDGFAFKIFGRTDKRGRPYIALIFTMCIGAVLAYLNVSSTGAAVFSWFSSISGMAFFISWLMIIACNWRFHAAMKAQGDDTLQRRFAFRAYLWPWASIAAFIAIAFMVVCQLIVSVSPIDAPPSASHFFSHFLGIPIFLLMWLGYKTVYWKSGKARWKRLQDLDLQTGRRADDPEEIKRLEKYAALSREQRILTFLRF